jgi:3-phenylpropionate/trans-cinnamate dioxygenase ferredoxin reductase component
VAERAVDFLIVGGGPAGFSAARTLREEGAEGSILIVSRDPDPPYDRTAVSKGYLGGNTSRKDTLLGDAAWYAEHDVELLTRTSAMKVDPGAHTVTLANKDVVSYGKLLLATGANVRRLRLDGCDLDGIHYLRALANADHIRDDTEKAGHVVLIGGSYIGTEVAATLTSLGRKVAIVMQEEVTLERGFGKTVGHYFQSVLEQHGVEVHGGEEIERFEGVDGRVVAVVTKAGTRIPADAVIVGAGVTPDVMLASRAGLVIGDKGGVLTDATLKTSADDVYAAGDIAEWDSPFHDGHVRIEHWDVAEQQGKTAGLNMLGREQPHDTIPYFFSDLADWASMEYVGPAYAWTEEVVRGSIDEGKFTVYYLDGDRLVAALSVGRGDDLDQARELIASREPVDRAALTS